MTVPIYLAECSPVHMRGRLTVADNVAISGGQFVAGIVDYVFSSFLMPILGGGTLNFNSTT